MLKLNNERGESAIEILSLLAMAAFLIVPFFIIGLPNWGWLFVVIGLTVCAWEAWSQWKKGKTISRQFWNWSIRKDESYTGTNKWKMYPNLWKGLAVLVSMQIGWFMLLYHLAIKMLRVLFS